MATESKKTAEGGGKQSIRQRKSRASAAFVPFYVLLLYFALLPSAAINIHFVQTA